MVPVNGTSRIQPTGATGTASLGVLASQQGVLLDSFKAAGDADDRASMTRAVTAGVPIILAPRTYTINNFSTGSVAQFVLRGIKGQSVIQRTSASGSQWFQISAATVDIDGVTFDANKASVTANQWGVYLAAGGQSVNVRNSVFKNNSGTIGMCFGIISTGPSAGGSFSFVDNEVTSCSWNALYLTSVAHGIVSGNYIHDNGAFGVYASSNGPASATNYLTDVLFNTNRVERNGTNGIVVGGYAPPYNLTVPPATHVVLSNNAFVDNVSYGLLLEGDYLHALNNEFSQSSPTVTVYGALDATGRYSLIQGNIVTLTNTPWGIDVGGSVQMTLKDNFVTMTQGAALNVGGNLNSVISGNHLVLSGSAVGISLYAVEQGGGAIFPTIASGNVIENNTIDISNVLNRGIQLLDNPGGYVGTTAQVVRRNTFNVSGAGTSPINCITCYGSTGSVLIDGNTYNGSNRLFVDPLGNGDVIFDLVYFGGTILGGTSTTPIRSILPSLIETYGPGGSILYVTPSNGGSGYTAATTLAATGSTGGSGWIGTAQIIGGVIVGVKTTAFGASYSGTITVAATDSGGGSGATFTVGNIPRLPVTATMTYLGNSNTVLQRTGGTVGLGFPLPIQIQAGTAVQLQALSNNTWNVVGFTEAVFAVGNLPTCNAASSGSTVTVTGSTTSKWRARCNGTNWLWPDGTTVTT